MRFHVWVQARSSATCLNQFALQEGRSLSGLLEAALPPVLHIAVVVAPNALDREDSRIPPRPPRPRNPFPSQGRRSAWVLGPRRSCWAPEDVSPRGLPDDGALGARLHLA